jgi:hypothetical protein
MVPRGISLILNTDISIGSRRMLASLPAPALLSGWLPAWWHPRGSVEPRPAPCAVAPAMLGRRDPARPIHSALSHPCCSPPGSRRGRDREAGRTGGAVARSQHGGACKAGPSGSVRVAPSARRRRRGPPCPLAALCLVFRSAWVNCLGGARSAWILALATLAT